VIQFGDPSIVKHTLPPSVVGLDALYESMEKCQRSVLWKDSTAHFVLNDLSQINRLHTELTNGVYAPRKGRRFFIARPKKREALSISFRDRVYQRSLNDNLLYPEITKHLIYDNCACQKGKGTDFCRDRLKCHLQRFYRKHGVNGYILQCDVKGYYPNLKHEVAEAVFYQYLSRPYADEVAKILRSQYSEETGFLPGSQLLQLVGIAVLNGLDHFIKEKLKIKHYIRYMDDFILVHEDKEYLAKCREKIEQELGKIGLSLHPTKTRLFPVSRRFKYVGFLFQLTHTGKVLMFVDPKIVKETRRRLKRLEKSTPILHSKGRYYGGPMQAKEVQEKLLTYKEKICLSTLFTKMES